MTPAPRAVALVVLAAGEGTRMRSAHLPKVLHGFAGRSLLGHVLAAAAPLGAARTLVVVGHGREEVTAHLAQIAPDAQAVVQDRQGGTGHAVRVALEALAPDDAQTVVVLPGDTPLLLPNTLTGLLAAHTAGQHAVTLLTSVVPDPTGYGRVLHEHGSVRVVEHRDATLAERDVREIATGVYAFEHAALRDAVGRLSTDNAQGEEYLPDTVAILGAAGRAVGATTAAPEETAGVNDRLQLAAAHRVYNGRLLEAVMLDGVTVVDPLSTWLDADVRLAPDVTVLPGCRLTGTTSVAAGAVVGPQTTLTDTTVGADSVVEYAVCRGATIGAGCAVGPYAYLRPGAELADGAKVGTYVEVKASTIGAGSKVPHLTYVGDATIGEHSNIGASSVFVNYDGVTKRRSVVGDHVRTGADTMFVAPVHIGDGAYTAAGSVITEDVPPGAMGVARAKQRNVAGWVARRRAGTASAQAAARAAERSEDAP